MMTDNHIRFVGDIKRLFFVWFTSISNHYESIDKSQFQRIINRIFSTNGISERKISEIFDQLLSDYGDYDKECIYFHKFLSKNEDKFADIMAELLQNDFTALSMLKSVPNCSINNPANDTLQQILSDLTKEVLILRKWMTETGLPFPRGKQTLQNELSNAMDHKARLETELQLVEEEKNNLKSDQEVISQSYSMLQDSYSFSVKQNTDLKSINEDYVGYIDKLQTSLDAIETELSLERSQIRDQNETINKLTKFVRQYKTINNELMLKNDQQTKQITDLECRNRQNTTEVESLTSKLEQRNDEINKLRQELEVVNNTLANTYIRAVSGRYDTDIKRFNYSSSSLIQDTSHLETPRYSPQLVTYKSSNSVIDDDQKFNFLKLPSLRILNDERLSGFMKMNTIHSSNSNVSATDIDKDFQTFEPKLEDLEQLDGLKRKHFDLMLGFKKQLEDISNTFKTDGYDCEFEESLMKQRERNKNVDCCDLFGFWLQ